MSHVSFSALKIWNECPYRYKLEYEDRVGVYTSTPYTIFGTALHEAAELKVLDENVDEKKIFLDKFESEVKILKENNFQIQDKLIDEMREQGLSLAPQIIPSLKEKFGEFKVLAAEEEIYELIKTNPEINYNFKGFIDLIIQVDDTIHIIDWKSCSWGWDAKKKADKMTTYQLTFYKHFYAQKYNIDLKKIETHFALLKRTAKKNNIEIFRVTSGSKKIQNALTFLDKALYNINKKNFPKNKLNCKFCSFNDTDYCP